MLPAKPWKPEAVVRLLVCVFICHFLGAVAMGVVQLAGGVKAVNAKAFFGLAAGAVVFLGASLVILHKPWPTERFTRRFMILLGCLYLGLTLGSFAQHYAGNTAGANETWRVAIATLSFQGAAIALIGWMVREHQTSWAEAFGFSVEWKQAVLFGVLVACSFLPVGWGLQLASAELLSRLGSHPELQQAVQVLEHTETWRDRAIMGVAALALAPVAEEMLFRGVLYPAVKQVGFPRLALWGTSTLFAAVHWNLPTFLPLLLLAVLLTVLYEKTSNLLAPIVAHSLFNAFNFASLYLFQSPPHSPH